jgi:hypothetical protein
MKNFSVSLDVVSTELRLGDLTAQLGAEPSEDSHDLGSPRGRGTSWPETVWRLDSDAPESAPLEVHCQSLLDKARAAGVLDSLRHLRNAAAHINVAVFFDTAYCSVPIPPACLEAIRDHGLGLEVTCYPSEAG